MCRANNKQRKLALGVICSPSVRSAVSQMSQLCMLCFVSKHSIQNSGRPRLCPALCGVTDLWTLPPDSQLGSRVVEQSCMHCFSVASLGGCQNSKEYPAEALHVALVDFAHLCHRVAMSKACKQPTSCICLDAHSRAAYLYCAAVKEVMTLETLYTFHLGGSGAES